MGLNVGHMVSKLRRMTVTELRRRYAEVFDESARFSSSAIPGEQWTPAPIS